MLALALGLGGFVYLAETRPTPAPSAPEARRWPVETLSVSPVDHRPMLTAYGEIVAGREADLRAPVTGEVVAVGPGYRDGSRVDAGAMLLQLDPFDYESALAEQRAERAEAEARLRELQARRRLEAEALERDRELLVLVERELERRQRLLDRGVASDQAVDDVRQELLRMRQTLAIRENTLAAEEARIEQQEAAIARLQARIARAQRDLDRTRITAPFAGLLTETGAELGQRLAVNEAVARLIDPTRLEARFQLSERQYGRLLGCRDGLIGRPVTVDWDIGEANRRYAGTIERIDAELSMDRGGVALFARLDALPADTPLRPGGFVTVELADCAWEDVVLLPAAAIHDGNRVYIVDEDNRLAERRVVISAETGGRAVVTGGLAPGERVVTNRLTEIRPGAPVEPVPTAATAERR
jgi:RND family efflux transporter MFP subunit